MTEATISSHSASRTKPRRLSDGMFAFLLTVPGLALLLAVVVYPLITALVTAFFKQSLVTPGREFVGLQNIVDVLQGDFLRLLGQTLVFTMGTTLAPFVIGFGLALALSTKIRGTKVLRGVMLIRGSSRASSCPSSGCGSSTPTTA